MSFLSDPIRVNRGALAAVALGCLLLGVLIGRSSRRPPEAELEKRDSAARAIKSTTQKESSAAHGTDGRRAVVTALAIPKSRAREGHLFERGAELATGGFETAMAALDSIDIQTDRNAFIEGMFSYFAEHLDPAAAIELAAKLTGPDRRPALRELAAAWTSGRTRVSAKPLIERFGIEAGIGLALAWDEAYRSEFGEAWAKAFADADGIGVMLGSFGAKHLAEDPQKALAVGAQLKGWQHEVFLRALTAEWANLDPDAAWEWATGEELASSGKLDGVRADILRRWSNKDTEAATAALATLEDPAERSKAAAAIAMAIAHRSGTVAAVDWANSLPSEQSKDAAHDAIAKTAPQGIGAVLAYENGFPVIGGLVPGGAAERGGQLQSGDRIVEVDAGNGRFELVYGRPLEDSLGFIQGEAGSEVRLRIVREADDGSLQDRIITIEREQIVLPGGSPDGSGPRRRPDLRAEP